MDREDMRKNCTRDLDYQDTYDTRQAKQRASIKWLLSKAYNNRVPDNLKEPFYRDHEDQEHLKPQIVHNLASAELYCLALANIYSDPNYHNLNHCGILQTLSRKGISIPDPPDGPLTETVLIQTTPLKLGAHMAVIEATMVLYAKEVVTPDRVVAAINRFTHGQVTPDLPQDTEDSLLLWVNHSQTALTKRIQLELERERDTEKIIPNFPQIKDVKELSDGVGLAVLISFYCPEELPWTDIKIPYLPTVSDSVHNLCLVHEFSHHSLPHTVCHMMPEDVTYLQGNMKQNLLVLLADLFNVLEIHPVKCVRFPGSERSRDFGPARNSQGVAHKRSLPQVVSVIPDLRSNLATNSSFTVSKSSTGVGPGIRKSLSSPHSDLNFRGSPDSLEKSHDDRKHEESFVVHRGKRVPTLNSVNVEDPLIPARLRPNKEKINQDTKADERGELSKAAGKPSNWEDQKRTSYAGRRSRRNSLSEESQLTLENFGGSQENLHFLGRNPDKEPAIHIGGRLDNSSTSSSPAVNVPLRTSLQETRSTGVELIFAENKSDDLQPVIRKDSRKSQSPTLIQTEPNIPVRSSQQDARSNAIDKFFADNGYGLEKRDEEKPTKETNLVSLKNLIHSSQIQKTHNELINNEYGMSPVDYRDNNTSEINITYNEDGNGDHLKPQKSSLADKKFGIYTNLSEKKTTFAALPNTTTWQQQKSINNINNNNNNNNNSNDNNDIQEVPNIPDETSNMQLHNIRLKLEEKRRVIENEKRRMELLMNKQRQKVGKAAFLQAITKDKLKTTKSNSGNVNNARSEYINSISSKSKIQRLFSFQDLKEDVLSVEKKWLDNSSFVEEKRTPDLENLEIEHYQQSIAQMNSSLKELDADMQRLSKQQTHLQELADDFRMSQNDKQYNMINQSHLMQTFTNQNSITNPITLSNITNQSNPVPNYSNLTNSMQQPKPISLSQLHQQNQNQYQNQNPGQFFLHEQQVTRKSWSQHYAERTWNQSEKNERTVSQPFTLHDSRLPNGSTHPTPIPRSINSSPLHLSKSKSKPIVPPRQTPPTSNLYPAPLPTPSVDDMEPQSICFIGKGPTDEVDDVSVGMSHINITSGSRTYRIPSPTRPSLIKSQFIQKSYNQPLEDSSHSASENQPSEKGFYISFDDEAPPKRPKPPLRGKRSPKKERFVTQTIGHPYEEKDREDQENFNSKQESIPRTIVSNFRDSVSNSRVDYSPDSVSNLQNSCSDSSSMLAKKNDTNARNEITAQREKEPASPNVGLIIGTEPDPNAIDEMERKKEKILMLSLQRRQQQEEMKARKEIEAAQRREIEKLKEEDRARKKEEEKARRAAILEQYKLKKAIEEAEREGKVVDKAELMKLTTPKLRSKTATTSRPRPKTIHVESGGLEDGMLTPSCGKKGSSSNLADRNQENTVFTRPLRRDHYRGSQDSLASNAGGHRSFRDSPSDDGRGSSPSRISSNLGRRGSYKTSRDISEPPSQVRGRSKYSTYQSNFRGRKSNSLMNLCGSSSDQDSLAYRYGDTDSGLGRATPPRRAPSPGINSGRHLTSPSGPGSLPPGLISKRRIFDDGSSDISSNASSMMEYTGPRLYKQPATKSNRGIMLNAVEYCVFPGAVNKEAKQRVLEEVSRSLSKYFLILFRDAGCQFRALYSYCPDTEEVIKLYGTGPKMVNDKMFDKFFKYNSGGKCFSQVHTKHLTVTIDAFTIHNSLWQGKKVQLPSKKDMALVI